MLASLLEDLCAWLGGLLFEVSVLAYDPANNEVEWILVWGTAEDFSQVEASAREFSSMVQLDLADEVQRLDRFGE